MVNPHKGEVGLKIGEETFTLSFSAGALAELETAMGINLDEIAALLQDSKRIRIAHWRTMFFHALLDHHEDVDEAKAKVLFRKLSVAEAMKAVGQAYGLAFKGLTDLAETNEAEAAANPPQPGQQAPNAAESERTGPASSTPGANSAEAKPNSGG